MTTADRPDALVITNLRPLVIAKATPQCRIDGHFVRLALGCGPGPWDQPGANLASDRMVIEGLGEDGQPARLIYRIGAYHENGDWY